MGQHDVSSEQDQGRLRTFVRALLDDVHALERMCADGSIETGVRRIGAEQEIFLVDRHGRPAPFAPNLIDELGEEAVTTELGQFNLEVNLSPQDFEGDCLRRIEDELVQNVGRVRSAVRELGGDLVLTGILPTLEKRHLELDYMTPSPRYFELNRVMREQRGREFLTYIKGLDELHVHHDNVMLEACNTSFQVHFQVGPDEFASYYNIAQAVTGPVLAAAVNSPLLLQHRLWHETRVALFQQSLDARTAAEQTRGGRQRVHFGDGWVRESVLELFRDDIARNRVLLATDLGDSSLQMLERGEAPPLRALCLHNGTVYRWNRPCYGVADGQAHLRIENRTLPAGPTIVDEVANAALHLGLLAGFSDAFGAVDTRLAFDDAKRNFMTAARYGLDAQFDWLDGRKVSARELLLEELLPVAREGLASRGVVAEDIARYLDVVAARVESGRTGARWMLDSHAATESLPSRDARSRAVTQAMVRNCAEGAPVHEWEVAPPPPPEEGLRESFRTVGQFMTTDIFTAHPEDLVDLAASVMEWEHIRHVPVEDAEGHLVGLVSHRALLRLIGRGSVAGSVEPVAVRDIMRPDPVTVSPDASSLEAMQCMREHKVGCLPVVQSGKLVGIVTEHDFIEMARTLLEEELRRS